MKLKKYTFLAPFLVLFLIACEQNVHLEKGTAQSEVTAAVNSGITPEASVAGTCNPNAYIVTLESRTLVGSNWEWVWSVQNPNPGNGNNGTVQNLSHWGMQFGACFVMPNVIGAAYSFNNTSWTSFTPSYSVDPSQNCMTTPVLKFDVGTNGTAKTYYKLVLNADFPVAPAPAYYKSGNRTGCCTFTFEGIGCPGDGSDR